MAEYLIWSNEHQGWWKPGEWGYTTITHLAGRYSKERADAICARANQPAAHPEGIPNEVALLAPEPLRVLEEFHFVTEGER